MTVFKALIPPLGSEQTSLHRGQERYKDKDVRLRTARNSMKTGKPGRLPPIISTNLSLNVPFYLLVLSGTRWFKAYYFSCRSHKRTCACLVLPNSYYSLASQRRTPNFNWTGTRDVPPTYIPRSQPGLVARFGMHVLSLF